MTARLGGLAIGNGVRRTVLGNGLTVLTKPVRTSPIVASVIWYRVGARNESLGRTGTSHFLEHMLFKGTERFSKGAIDLLTLKNGGANNAFTWLDYTAFYFTFASDRWELALEIEADRMRNTLFEADEFASEKQVVIEELQIGLDGPWDELEHEVWAAAFRQHPYHNPTVGWIGDLAGAGAADMKAYYDAWYHPRNATLVLVGDIDEDAALDAVERRFSGIPAGPEAAELHIVEPRQRGERRLVLKKPTLVERLIMAFHAPEVGHPDSYALQVAEAALSTGKTSRLYRRLVEQDQSVTMASAGYSEHIDPSLFVFRAELKPDNSLEDVERAVTDEICRIRDEGLTTVELERVKRRIRADLILSNEQILNQAILLGEYETIARNAFFSDDDRGFRYLDTYLDRMSAVTDDDVRRVVAEYLTDDRRTVGQLISSGEPVDNVSSPSTAGESTVAYRTRPNRDDLEAQDPAPAIQAVSGARTAIHVERFVLPNGLTVLLTPTGELPAFCLNVVVSAGARYETDETAGLASLTGGLLEEGTKGRTSDQIAESVENVGAHLLTFGGYTHSGVRVIGLSEDLGLSIDLAADCLRNPVFPQDRVQLHVDRRVALIKSRLDQPRMRAAEEFDEIVYQGHPSHRPGYGYERSVAGLTADHLRQFHASFYHPNNTILALAGNFDVASAREAIERYFGSWERNEAFRLPLVPELARQTAPVEKFVHADKTQTNLYLGHLGIHRKHPDYYALLVLDTILGSSPGFTSRIPRVLRDEMGLAYSTFSNITGSAGIDPGRFVAFIGTSPANLDQAVDGLRREIARIVEEPVEADELDTAKSYLTGSFVFKFQTNAQLASYLIDAEVFDLGFDFRDRYPQLIDEITVEDVLRVARVHIDPESMTLVVVGPRQASAGRDSEG